ncbi:integrase core domain-containing protein [Marilutibacter alkalisoli]|nr:integrase core domain-containing protein [Lysobacter alkalisoli]
MRLGTPGHLHDFRCDRQEFSPKPLDFRRHAGSNGMTVGHDFVNELRRNHAHEIQRLRKQIAQRRPGPGRKNRIWAMDGSTKTDTAGERHFILGLLDHGTRRCLALHPLPDKRSLTLLRVLLGAIVRHGRPKVLRTDNEAIFTSRLFRFGLQVLGIRHQTTDLHSPWQNGRIERLFGTLKARLNHWTVQDCSGLHAALLEFRFWYNHVRPHQHLHGRTPAEVWDGIDIYRRPVKRRVFYEAWNGLLQGEWFIH